jgi:hypothetical protein
VSREWSPRGPKGIKYSFQKGDVIIPEDSVYPERALEILEMLPEGEFRAVPIGGGFVLRFGPEQMAKYRFRKVQMEEMDPPWRRGTFWMDALGELELDGWTTGNEWNGWATPVFEKKAAEAILKETAKMYKEIGEKFKWSYSAKTDTFTHQSEHDEEPEKAKGAVIETAEGPKKVYGIGTGFWTWSER